MLWFEQQVAGKNVSLVTRTEELSTIAIAGPGSRQLLSKAASGDVDNGSMPFMSARSKDVGFAPCLIARLSFTGELGYEMYVPAAYEGMLYDYLLEVGDSLGIRPFGIRALVSLGMEKSFGIWSREFTPDYTPAMCGFDRWVDYGKADFIGREAALVDRNAELEHKLVTLEIDSTDADAWGYEPIWYKEEYAGFVTSGAYGHTVEKSLALGYVKTQYLESPNGEFSVHVVDEPRPAVITSGASYDPSGSQMRS